MLQAETLAHADVRGCYAVLVYRGPVSALWSTSDTERGAKIARANARRAAAKYGFTDVRLFEPGGEEIDGDEA